MFCVSYSRRPIGSIDISKDEEMNSNDLWNSYNKFTLRKAKQFAPAVYKAIQAQIKYFTETQDLTNLPQGPIREVLTQLYTEVGRNWAIVTYYNLLKDAGLKHDPNPPLQIKRRAAIGLNEEFIKAILDFFATDQFNTIQNITQTTRNFIREQVNQGIQNQLSLDEIIDNLLSSGITKNRASLISRTETMKGANAAEQIGSDRTGLATRKEWISVRDHRTRHDHINVDGSIVPDGSPFNVGGYMMQRPGADKTTDGRRVPASEICNCRCVVGRVVLRGRDGLPLRKVG